MKIDIISSAIVPILKEWFLFGKIRRKSGHISEAPTQTALKAQLWESYISNLERLAGSETGIYAITSVIYYRKVAVDNRVFVISGSHDISRAVLTQEAIKPQAEDSLASEERPSYIFEQIARDPPEAEIASPNSTKERRRDKELERRITSLFMMSGEEEFESGMISDFSQELCSIIDNHGKDAMEIITYLFLYKEVNSEVLCEALRWLGRIDQVDSHSYRLWLLGKSLESPSIFVRDGAILGIAALDDPCAIPAVHKAIEKETCRELCDDMQAVLQQLEETTKWG